MKERILTKGMPLPLNEAERLVGSAASFVERCTVDPRLKAWL